MKSIFFIANPELIIGILCINCLGSVSKLQKYTRVISLLPFPYKVSVRVYNNMPGNPGVTFNKL